MFVVNFLDAFRREYSGDFILANKIYMSYITNTLHIRLNSTKWATFTDFIEIDEIYYPIKNL